MMTRQKIFEIWASKDSPWSLWAKAVVFSQIPDSEIQSTVCSEPTEFSQTKDVPSQRRAIVVDLPGASSVMFGLRMAEQGFRPVPLFNAVPGPRRNLEDPRNIMNRWAEIVDVNSVMLGLIAATSRLLEIHLRNDAPPAFLLDASRRAADFIPLPGQFDNRSITFPTDFPSATFLIGRGISEVLLIQTSDSPPQPDLAHTLLRWQNQGISVLSATPDTLESAQPILIPRPSGFRRFWYAFTCAMGLRRNPFGGFGGEIPYPSESSAG
jgi:hypothetical protein